MNGIPEPYPNGTQLLVELEENGRPVSKVLVVVDHIPHAEDWRYTGHPVTLGGREVHFSHRQAGPVPPSMLPRSAREIFEEQERTQDDLSIVAEETVTPAMTRALEALGDWYHGRLHTDELRGVALEYLERDMWGTAS